MILQLIRYGWNKARRWVWSYFPVLVLQWVLGSAVSWRRELDGQYTFHLWWHNMGVLGRELVVTALVLGALGYVVSRWVDMGILHGSVKAARGEDVAPGDFFISWKNVGSYVIASLLFGLIVGIGMVLLVVPGIIWGLRYSMYGYYVVTQDAGPMEALQMSADATDGHKIELLTLCLASLAVLILGVLCLGIGLVWAIPTVDIAWAGAFLQLSGEPVVPEVQPA